MAFVYPYDNPKAWVPRVRGASGAWVELPGDARIKTPRVKWKVDKQGGTGTDGGSLTGQGRELQEWDIEIRTWDRAGFERLMQLAQAISKSAAVKVYDVYHPQLEVHGIRRMVIEELQGPDTEGSGGWFTLRLHCVRWAPPVKAATFTGKPKPVDTVVATAVPGEGPPIKLPPPIALPATSGAKPKP